MRYFLEFAYNGTHYHGWQIQPNANTVQETLTTAISTLLRAPIELVGAGRTDAGVHAKQMFAHFDYEISFDKDSLIQKMNSFLPQDIVVYAIHPVDTEAHARFDATARTYEYHMHLYKDAFCNNLSFYHFKALDVQKMNEAAKVLFEYEDFECFSKTHTDVFTFNCTIYRAEWTVIDKQKLVFTISANRFLRNMVRAIVGTLVNVGLGKISVEDVRTIIESKDRGQAGFSVPGKGLFLTQVSYPYL
ncbi:tRNA pseudouridine(38-40) synthase TruA [Myroides pelagicus]|uniref:tRNA pseudouridine synthase A n=1 Tax=Myroides pelagicus TaxID=270914 RepID=A0A7K1GM86_9FLAO|nr:tRNA pseudouridine(38-40) synthase TruA [Myroides pelagicus]MEC4114274.1 tRNA pseudouridine(38-40) synthase TruA [Myroides pelagicus]MTH29324.1 tRNA pseudouridine(38-40) synthase TruA [Myroides pelagicus]